MTFNAVAHDLWDYTPDWSSPAVSTELQTEKKGALKEKISDNSISLGHEFRTLLVAIANVRFEASENDWDGDGARAVSPAAVYAAISLADKFPDRWKAPEVAAESDGSIAFEWYVDRAHVVTLATDGSSIRWSAALGPGRTTAGREPCSREIPSRAREAVEEVIG